MLTPVNPQHDTDIVVTVDGKQVRLAGAIARVVEAQIDVAVSVQRQIDASNLTGVAYEKAVSALQVLQALVAADAGAALERGIRATGSVDNLAARMLAAVPDERPEIDALVGPFFDTSKLATWRDVRKQAIQKAAAKHDILGMKMADNVMVFPAFQFGPHGENLPHLREVLALLDPDWVDPWGSALWLNTADPEFGGTTAAEAIRDGRADVVLEAARAARSAWAS